MKVLLTGATGFVGKAVSEKLIETGVYLVASVREKSEILSHQVSQVLISDLTSETDWSLALKSVDVVIHSAARVHVMNDTSEDPLAEFRKVNLEGTMALALQAVKAGVKRFIFISSIKVNGESTLSGRPFTADDTPSPLDAYGISKAETEEALMEISLATKMEVVIIRPVLVYGPEVKANFLNMMSWLNHRVPLPLGNIQNQRSLLALDNLIDFILLCVDYKKSPKASNQIFLISDGEDVSTTELLRKTANALGKRPLLISVPVWLMKFAANLLGKGEVANRLFSSLQVDNSKAKELLGWTPVINMDEQLKKTAEEYLKK